MPGPLQGYRVVDLTTVLMGPIATQILGDMGADVIKVESPEGDVTRGASPARHQGMGAVYLNINRSKRGVVLDLKQAAGREALLRLVAGADVFVHSMRPETMARLGLAYEDCRAVNPRLVYCGCFGFHQDGPYADRAAYDDVIQGLSGLAAIQAMTTGEPRYLPTVAVDKTVGVSAVYAIAMALLHRERTGEGQLVEVPMFETMTQFNLMEHMTGMLFVPREGEAGYARLRAPHRRPYRTKDGYVCTLPYTTRHWQRFFALAGRPEMIEDARVTDPARRSESVGELYAMVAEVAKDWTTAELLAGLEEADIPAAAVTALDDLPEDPHLKATGFFQEVEHPTEGRLLQAGVPIRFSASPGAIQRHAPRLGEHSVEILREAGYAEAEIGAMLRAGATLDGRDEA